MKKHLTSKYLAYDRVQEVLASNQAVVDSNPTLKNAAMEFGTRFDAIADRMVPERGATRSLTVAKSAAFRSLTDQFLSVTSALLIYAAAKPDNVLVGKLPINRTGLRAGNEVTRVLRFRMLLNEAKALPEAVLAPLGLSAATLSELEADLAVLEDLLGSPRSAVDKRILQREQQESDFRQMDEFLKNTLDLAVNTRLLSNPEFVSAYFLARKLHAAPSRSSSKEADPQAGTTSLPATGNLPTARADDGPSADPH